MSVSGVAVALGANLGDPAATLLAVRPRLEEAVAEWWPGAAGRWSPRFRTAPVGGPPGQPPYLNAVALFTAAPPPPADPLPLLHRLQALERRFGRRRRIRWGPRRLDLDLLWCGEQCRSGPELQLPHPRLVGRCFVLAPLAAIDPALVPPGQAEVPPRPCGALLASLQRGGPEPPPLRLPPAPGWPE
ncbi:MAG: 2-amino-4-hydroxy-6-hydroxymethyldihydropteridine diphosphokinase [Synechococcaceae cyanobacterium]|nr:2-amino-4-hydroxy-6-hydroxymethyldihydropteridine diphosphokinase [Synechococcaceae cyanobacterium]